MFDGLFVLVDCVGALEEVHTMKEHVDAQRVSEELPERNRGFDQSSMIVF
jgi:hypothetical protein